MKVKVLRYNKVSGKESFLGYMDILIEDWSLGIKGMTVHSKNGRVFFNFPSKQYQNKDGENAWSNTVFIENKDLYAKFEQGLRQAFEEHNNQPAQPMGQSYNDGLPF